MESSNWAPEHSGALREYLALGMTYSQIARAINAKFNTHYTRSAALSRARRIGLVSNERPADLTPPAPQCQQPSLSQLRKAYASASRWWFVPNFEREDAPKLRCVDILKPAIATIPMGAMRRAKRSPSAGIRGARTPATARRIFI
jgi:GcrA cell cycle regulator